MVNIISISKTSSFMHLHIVGEFGAPSCNFCRHFLRPWLSLYTLPEGSSTIVVYVLTTHIPQCLLSINCKYP